MKTIPAEGFLDLKQIIGVHAITPEQASINRTKKGMPVRPREEKCGVFPISRTSWYEGIKKGIYPAPVKYGSRSLWRCKDIRALLEGGAK